MRIALCISGYFNSTKDKSSRGLDGFNHIKNHILHNKNVDIFIHSWDINSKIEIENLYAPYLKESFFEPQIDFKPIYFENNLDIFKPHGTPFWNVLSQYYSVQKSFELCYNTSKKYDCVIKARFDLGRINRKASGNSKQNPYAVQCINFDISLNMNNLYMADWQYINSEGPADMWFYSGYQNMKNFTKVFDILSKDIRTESEFEIWAGDNDGGIVNAIKGWKWFFIKTNLWEKKSLLPTYWE